MIPQKPNLKPFSLFKVQQSSINQKPYAMYYTYDKSTLRFVRVNWLSAMLKVIVIFVVLISLFGLTIQSTKQYRTESEVMIIMAEHNEFSADKLIGMIKEMNFRYPHIVYAQAILETSNFQSRIFKENHNIFGMKQAVIRITKSLGTQYEHAYYKNWMESLDDYALYSATYLSPLNTESEYFNYLGQNYAEDTQYVFKLKQIIIAMDLKSKFNYNGSEINSVNN